MFRPFTKEEQVHRTEKPKYKGIKPGKKTLNWEKARKILKQKFARTGITTCEIRHPQHCSKDNFLTFAHIDKRRYLSEGEVGSPQCVVLACQGCHAWVEGFTRLSMRSFLFNIINNRKIKVL